MTRLLWLCPLLLLTLVPTVPSITPSGTAALSTFLKSATDRSDVPGVVVAVVNKDGVLYNDAFGLSRTLGNRPMARDTIFNIASMTKPITSVAIMMLVDEGRLTVNDDVGKYLPKYKNPIVLSSFNEADGSYETRPAKRPITIRHLLTHTSGLAYGFANAKLTKIMQKTGKPELDLPLLFDPGDSWAYGPSTRVLGEVVETISGMKLDAFLESRILQPLGMSDTSYAGTSRKISARCCGERAPHRWEVGRAADAGGPSGKRRRGRRPLQHRYRLRNCSFACSSTAARRVTGAS